MPAETRKNISLTAEVLARLNAEPNASHLIEALLRAHYGMPPAPDRSARPNLREWHAEQKRKKAEPER